MVQHATSTISPTETAAKVDTCMREKNGKTCMHIVMTEKKKKKDDEIEETEKGR